MGYFDVSNNIPIEISLEGEKNKNNDLITLRKYIENQIFLKKYFNIRQSLLFLLFY